MLALGMPITSPNKRKNRRQRNETKKEETDAVHELDGKCKRLKTGVSSLLSTSKELYEKCEKSGVTVSYES